MQAAGEGSDVPRQEPDPVVPHPRPAQSGEGARSAMEQLIQQRGTRDAQLPREDRRDGGPPAARPG